jgi:hypothetical protein
MEQFYETSLSAYILLQEVRNEMGIKETKTISRRDGTYKRILKECNKLIERRYSNKEQQIKLKTYVENIFYRA